MIAANIEAVAILSGVACIAGLGTWILSRAIGPALLRRSSRLAEHVCAGVIPALTILVGIILHRTDSARYPKSDGPPMAMSGMIMLAVLLYGVTIPVARWQLRSKRSEP